MLLFVCSLLSLLGIAVSEIGRKKVLHSVHEHEIFSAVVEIIVLYYSRRIAMCGQGFRRCCWRLE
jgi:hypothetical protein